MIHIMVEKTIRVIRQQIYETLENGILRDSILRSIFAFIYTTYVTYVKQTTRPLTGFVVRLPRKILAHVATKRALELVTGRKESQLRPEASQSRLGKNGNHWD